MAVHLIDKRINWMDYYWQRWSTSRFVNNSARYWRVENCPRMKDIMHDEEWRENTKNIFDMFKLNNNFLGDKAGDNVRNKFNEMWEKTADKVGSTIWGIIKNQRINAVPRDEADKHTLETELNMLYSGVLLDLVPLARGQFWPLTPDELNKIDSQGEKIGITKSNRDVGESDIRGSAVRGERSVGESDIRGSSVRGDRSVGESDNLASAVRGDRNVGETDERLSGVKSDRTVGETAGGASAVMGDRSVGETLGGKSDTNARKVILTEGDYESGFSTDTMNSDAVSGEAGKETIDDYKSPADQGIGGQKDLEFTTNDKGIYDKAGVKSFKQVTDDKYVTDKVNKFNANNSKNNDNSRNINNNGKNRLDQHNDAELWTGKDSKFDNDQRVGVNHERNTRFDNDQRVNVGNTTNTGYNNDQNVNAGHERTTDYGNEQAVDIGHEITTNYGNEQHVDVGHESTTNYGNEQHVDVGNENVNRWTEGRLSDFAEALKGFQEAGSGMLVNEILKRLSWVFLRMDLPTAERNYVNLPLYR